MSLEPATAPPDLVKYRLLDEIGHGGMATVYRAMDVRLGREVAVKLIHPHLRENTEATARFITEARAVAKLRHPGIVEIYDISDEDEAERYLVAQLVRGPSLRKVLRDRGSLPPEIGACVGVLLCDALAHAHDAGIVHRDVKPENVLIEMDDTAKVAEVKLTDFGIAKLIDAQGVTSTGQVLGSPAHMAPEQIEGGQVDARTDIFSVGVLIYECMVGHLPFDGKNPAQVLRRVLEGSYSAADKENPAVGARWSAIIARAIAKEPGDRYEDVRELAAEMRGNLVDVGIEEPLAEIYRYLTGPEEYEAALAHKLVSLLVARAERARASGNIQAAAADLNRAVAYAPDDTELLRRVTSLARGQRTRRLLRQALAIVVPFAILSVGAYAVVSAVRSRPRIVVPAPSTPLGPTAPPSLAAPIAPDTSVVAPVASVPPDNDGGSAGGRPAGLLLPKLQLNEAFRVVDIKANPQSAMVSIDGASAQPVNFGLKTTLRVGGHTLVFSAPKGDPCCESVTQIVEVKAAEQGAPPQSIFARLAFRDARLSLVGGPSNGKMSCPGVRAEVRTGGQVSVRMFESFTQASCFFDGSGLAGVEKQVVLKAGEPTVVGWPQP